eukprot:2444004-Rhodomonas_salina.1
MGEGEAAMKCLNHIYRLKDEHSLQRACTVMEEALRESRCSVVASRIAQPCVTPWACLGSLFNTNRLSSTDFYCCLLLLNTTFNAVQQAVQTFLKLLNSAVTHWLSTDVVDVQQLSCQQLLAGKDYTLDQVC